MCEQNGGRCCAAELSDEVGRIKKKLKRLTETMRIKCFMEIYRLIAGEKRQKIFKREVFESSSLHIMDTNRKQEPVMHIPCTFIVAPTVAFFTCSPAFYIFFLLFS